MSPPSVPPPAQSKPVIPVKPTVMALTLAALAAMETLIIENALKGITKEAEQAWEKYQKVKSLALNPGTKGEEQNALKQALLLAVKLAF